MYAISTCCFSVFFPNVEKISRLQYKLSNTNMQYPLIVVHLRITLKFSGKKNQMNDLIKVTKVDSGKNKVILW